MAQIIDLYGFSLKENTIYEIREKLDPDAPDGYVEYETTKALINAVHNVEPAAVWDGVLGVWDTGLFLESPYLIQASPDPTVRAKDLSKLHKSIVEPLEKLKGVGVFDNTSNEKNDAYWNNYGIEVKRGKVFNTGNPEELYQLFILVLTKRLTPKELTSHPEFKKSQYIIIDKEESYNKESEKALRQIRAYELFTKFKATDRPHLVNILEYAGLKGVTETTNDDTMSIAFKRFIEDKLQGAQNASNFIDVAEMTSKKDIEMLYVYGKLKEYHNKGAVRKTSGGVYIGEEYISNSFKNAAEEIVSKKELKKLFNEISVE